MEKNSKLLLLLGLFVAVTALFSTFPITPALMGLSTVMATTVLASTVLSSTVLSTTAVLSSYNSALLGGQVIIGVVAIGALFFYEVSDKRYGKVSGVLSELRSSWLPISALFLIMLLAIVVLKLAAF